MRVFAENFTLCRFYPNIGTIDLLRNRLRAVFLLGEKRDVTAKKREPIQEIDARRLRQLLSYNPQTGLFCRHGRIAGNHHHTGYVRIGLLGEKYPAHRLVWLYVYGEWPDGDIDHINGERSDNRIENLRVVSRGENLRNKSRRGDNESGVTGVSWAKSKNMWRATICKRYNVRHLGYFNTKAEAVTARKRAELDLGFHPNHDRGPRLAA